MSCVCVRMYHCAKASSETSNITLTLILGETTWWLTTPEHCRLPWSLHMKCNLEVTFVIFYVMWNQLCTSRDERLRDPIICFNSHNCAAIFSSSFNLPPVCCHILHQLNTVHYFSLAFSYLSCHSLSVSSLPPALLSRLSPPHSTMQYNTISRYRQFSLKFILHSWTRSV